MIATPVEFPDPLTIAVYAPGCRVIDTADRHHVAAGCWFGKTEQALRTIRQGARLVVYSNDSSMMKDAMALAFGELRKG